MLSDDRKNLSICQEPHCFVLLDEISGGCPFPAAPQHIVSSAGEVGGSSVPPHVAVRRPGGRAASSPYAKGNPAPHPGLPSP